MMKNIFVKSGLVAFICMSLFGSVFARDCEWERAKTNRVKIQAKAASCKRAQSSAELNVNNVRALINAYGNMWYDGSLAKYNIPKEGTSTAMFCAALWIGGTDVDDQLRIAALRFGSEGNDYWPGPLTVDGTASVSAEVCNEYDKHYKISQSEVSSFMSMFDYDEDPITHQLTVTKNDSYDESLIPDVIKNWPAHGNTAMKQSRYLAPFFDVDDDGEYNWEKGDYPYYDFDNVLCPKTLKANLKPGEHYSPARSMEQTYGTGGSSLVVGSMLSDQVLKGDQTIWWVFNDMGNSHTESKGEQIGLEIRAQAFAFATNDEINNMTFYTYEIINRSSYTLKNTYFSQWVDPDLGYAADDYVGCDVRRGLGYCYNGKDVDGPGTGAYGGIPPAVGIDFFQGPYMDADGKDNPKIDIVKMGLYYPEALETYKLYDSVTGNFVGYDTIQLSENAEAYINAWYFQKDDIVGNCAINGVNFGNGIVDDERFGMRRFVYYNNSLNNVNGEPDKATAYYNYLRGYWKTGARMTFGGDGTKGGTDALECDFMFPGDSDPWNWGTNGDDPGFQWTEKTPAEGESGNNPGDRRFMQSAGPFTLKPGAINYITVGIPFAQATSGNAWSSVELLRQVDDKCQSLFENCFKILSGPEAPTVTVQELSNEVILYLSYENPLSNNNVNGVPETFAEIDPSIPTTYSVDTIINGEATTNIKVYTPEQRKYKFEGYQVYQLKDSKASVADIGDETKARLVYQCDIENYYDDEKTIPIGTLVNYDLDNAIGAIAPTVMVAGNNAGIRHSIRLTTDAFATGTNTKLVNNKEYYFVAIAYAHNRYKEYSPTDASKLDGQKTPYLAGRQNEWKQEIKPVKAIPHNVSAENGGTIIQGNYGTSPIITRIEGYGNGGIVLQLTKASIEELMGAKGEEGKPAGKFIRSGMNEKMENPCMIPNPSYTENHGPLNITIVDPLNVKPGKFYIRFNGVGDDARWTIERVDGEPIYTNSNGNPVYIDSSDFTISRFNEQLFLDLGIAVGITNVEQVASTFEISGRTILGGLVNNNSLLSSNMSFADPNKQWLSAIPDYDASPVYNWIRSGSQFVEGDRASFTDDTSAFTGAEAYLDGDYYKFQESSLNRAESYPIDKFSVFESVLSGSWAPYGLVSTRSYHPGFSYMYYVAPESRFDSLRKVSVPMGQRYKSRNWLRRKLQVQYWNKSLNYNDMASLPSVHIVITADQTKWTRCPVLEMCDDPTQSEGNALRFQMRKAYSVDKNGNVDTTYDRKYGMGWFPGYAIDVETGERLNMMFGEDSRYVQHHGRDMMWNPVSVLMDGTQNYVMGGGHFIYVLKSNNQPFVDISRISDNISTRYYKTPSYDGGIWAARMLESLDRLMNIKDASPTMAYCKGLLLSENDQYVRPARDSAALLFSSVGWVNMPVVARNFVFDNPKDIPCDVTIDISVKRPYAMYYSPNQTAPNQVGRALQNANNPMYMFEMTDDIITLTNQAGGRIDKQTLLDNIAVVPNPYYSSSEYETSSQLDSRVRITNLPANSKISIYTVDGTLVRKLGPSPSDAGNVDRGYTLDWDLKNHIGIPIAGGMYLIHVSVPEIGERVIKWFGTMRPVDLNSFK